MKNELREVEKLAESMLTEWHSESAMAMGEEVLHKVVALGNEKTADSPEIAHACGIAGLACAIKFYWEEQVGAGARAEIEDDRGNLLLGTEVNGKMVFMPFVAYLNILYNNLQASAVTVYQMPESKYSDWRLIFWQMVSRIALTPDCQLTPMTVELLNQHSKEVLEKLMAGEIKPETVQ
ncbi:TPA: hypothetical protein RPT54_004709 [Escherichia coli]|nr:hypothetical protein [Escherichia coli]